MTVKRLLTRHLNLLRDIADADGPGMGRLYVYAYLAVWKQHRGDGWDTARSYVTTEVVHTPGLAREITGTVRRLVEAGLVELGPPLRLGSTVERRSERPYVLTAAGRALLADNTLEER